MSTGGAGSGGGSGNGFGSLPPPPPPSFGASSTGGSGGFFGQQQPPSGFGGSNPFGQPSTGGFGSTFGGGGAASNSVATGAFGATAASGSAAAPAPPFGASTLGGSSSTIPFGALTAAPTNIFGASNPTTSFSGFSQPSNSSSAAGPFGTTATGFGTTSSSQASPFGGAAAAAAPSNTMNFAAPSTTFAAPVPTVGPFGFGASSSTFGGGGGHTVGTSHGTASAPLLGSTFDSQPSQQRSIPFDTAATAFGTNASSPFANNPFAAPSSTAAPTLTFGVSSSIGQHHHQRWDSGSNINMGGMSPFGGASPMQQHSDNEMEDDVFNKSHPPLAPATNLPFGNPAFAAPVSTWGSNSNPFGTRASIAVPDTPFSSSGGGPGNLSPIPESDMNDGSGGDGGPSGMTPFGQVAQPLDNDSQHERNHQLASLKAKLEEKKKRLEERRRRQREANAGSDDTGPAAPSHLRATAAPFVAGGAMASNKSSLAARNLERFGGAAALSAAAPSPPLLNLVDADAPVVAPTQRETLENAKALIGTCPYMCPDEELERREREDDIQLLEKVRPGELHPSSWTLRDTVVKRFRRSAADYKLDVPEWVRSPDALEKVCGYLEEWVMERDRQGPDPRFPDQATPAPLDVYQFIWDRTRMVRKDFILQNYVGTGGMCDARAVRCHERIARWHAMCEHQLSHIDDFRRQQSQQNIQELGQTMKTLNQYYDDALGRHLVEVPGHDGAETRTDMSKYSRGCSSNMVQGRAPTDFDGTLLDNSDSAALVRLRTMTHGGNDDPNHGTAETEMRGLYILLTIDNDGGMEVLNYAAKLFRDRPAIYHSQHVQLALAIFKAKREHNYAKFFTILRSPATPYLYACIMFKHVEIMRKQAFKLMSKTFGGRAKDTNDPIYDAYPLADLMHLLAFENAQEAHRACQHYNIYVENDTIYWRRSQLGFRERKDPEKGTVIPLAPMKMRRTIESKLRGCTRLAVCRGQVSGCGASPASQPGSSQLINREMEGQADADRIQVAAQQELADKQRQREEKARRQKEAEDLAEAEEKRRDAEEQQRRNDETERWARQQAEARRAREEAERAKAEAIRQAEADKQRREIERQEALRKAEEQRKAEILELERQYRAAEEKKRQEQEQIEREKEARAAVERQKQLQIEDEQRRRAVEAECARAEELRRVAERTRLQREADEWNNRIADATKQTIWLRYLDRFPKHLRSLDDSEAALSRIGRHESTETYSMLRRRLASMQNSHTAPIERLNAAPRLRTTIEKCIQHAPSRSHSNIVTRICNFLARSLSRNPSSAVVLLKVAVCVHSNEPSRDPTLERLLLTWLHAELCLGRAVSPTDGPATIQICFVSSGHGNSSLLADCDCLLGVALWLKSGKDNVTPFNNFGLELPGVLLILRESFDEPVEHITEQCCAIFGWNTTPLNVVVNEDLSWDAFASCLSDACDNVAWEAQRMRFVSIQKTNLDSFACLSLAEAIRTARCPERRDDLCQVFAIAGLERLVAELDDFSQNADQTWNWPPKEFRGPDGSVKEYFADSSSLPRNWHHQASNAGPRLADLKAILKLTLPDCVEALLAGASNDVLDECQILLDGRYFCRCLHRALLFRGDLRAQKSYGTLFLPSDTLKSINDRIKSDLIAIADDQAPTASSDDVDYDEYEYAGERIDRPPTETPLPTVAPKRNQISSDNFATDVSIKVIGSPAVKRARVLPPEAMSVSMPVHANVDGDKKQATNAPSQSQRDDSLAFTAKLEAMMNGSWTPAILVGQTTLSALLRNAPPVEQSRRRAVETQRATAP